MECYMYQVLMLMNTMLTSMGQKSADVFINKYTVTS